MRDILILIILKILSYFEKRCRGSRDSSHCCNRCRRNPWNWRWGTNGVDISVGKLMVYTGAAGIDPSTVLPLVIDAGTNREELLNNPMYLGNRHERVRGDRYYAFIDQFVETAERLFPKLYLHWEDFGRGNAANILNKYKLKFQPSMMIFKEQEL